ncbi:hypothetical protein SSAG_03145 [Streptomyces sp. Mg1]|nr:hypothetical protein SSAG_03145 [Streptomyces sp. Mg1]
MFSAPSPWPRRPASPSASVPRSPSLTRRAARHQATAAAADSSGRGDGAGNGRGGNGSGNGPRKVTGNPYSVNQSATMKVSAVGCGHGGTVWSLDNFPHTNLSAGSIGFATV